MTFGGNFLFILQKLTFHNELMLCLISNFDGSLKTNHSQLIEISYDPKQHEIIVDWFGI